MHPVQVSRSRDGSTPFERLLAKKPSQEFVTVWLDGVGKANLHGPDEQNESQISVRYWAWYELQH